MDSVMRRGAALVAEWSRAYNQARSTSAFSAITGLGWLTIAIASVAFTAGKRWNYHELIVVAIAALTALLTASLFLVGRSRYRVTLDLRSNRVSVGEHATGRLEIRNGAQRPMLASRMELPVGSSAADFRIPVLSGDEVHEELFVVPTHKRAVIPVGPARSVRGDALGLLRREVRWTDTELLYVHPRLTPLDGAAPGLLRDLEGQVTQDITNNDVAFHALRQYEPGDDRRYIHWKTSVRTGTLMVRQFEETRRSHIAICMSTAENDYADDEQFELAIEIAASVGAQAFRESRRLSVITSASAVSSLTVGKMLDGFSGVGLSRKADRIIGASRRAAREVPDCSVAVLVCGSEPTPAQIRTAGAAFPAGVRVVAIRAVPRAVVRVRTLSSITVATVGELADLPRALRRVRAS
jgi:Protein of unknown function DUF58